MPDHFQISKDVLNFKRRRENFRTSFKHFKDFIMFSEVFMPRENLRRRSKKKERGNLRAALLCAFILLIFIVL
jgi:hypothetical protein